jgi:hypothetical protein
MNPDYMHWYGWAPMKESLQKIRDEAKSLRAESEGGKKKKAEASPLLKAALADSE